MLVKMDYFNQTKAANVGTVERQNRVFGEVRMS